MTVKEFIDAAVRNKCPGSWQYAHLVVWMRRRAHDQESWVCAKYIGRA